MSATLSGLGSINGIELDAYAQLVTRSAARIAREAHGAVEFGDLIGPGWTGLREAASRFDPTRGIPFEKFASPRVRARMIDWLRATDQTPRSERRRCAENGTEPRRTITFGVEIEDGDPIDELSAEPFDADGSIALKEAAAHLFDGLSERDRKLALMRFVARMKLADIAVEFGLSEARCLQIEQEIRERLAAGARLSRTRVGSVRAEDAPWRPSAPVKGAVRVDYAERRNAIAPSIAAESAWAKQSREARERWSALTPEQKEERRAKVAEGVRRSWDKRRAEANARTDVEEVPRPSRLAISPPSPDAERAPPVPYVYRVKITLPTGTEVHCQTVDDAAEFLSLLIRKDGR